MTFHATPTIFTRLLAATAALFRVIGNRRKASNLYDLSDQQLEDIGLSRGDVRYALRMSYPFDPAPILAELAAERVQDALSHKGLEVPSVSPAASEAKTVSLTFSQISANIDGTSESGLAA